MWVSFSVKNAVRIGGAGTTTGAEFSPKLVEGFHASGTAIEGVFAVEQGAFYCSIVLATVTVLIIEKRLVAAALWAWAAAGLSLLGLLHAWKFSASDTVSALPLLECLTQTVASGGSLFPAAAYGLGYFCMGLVLLGARWFTEPGGDAAAQ